MKLSYSWVYSWKKIIASGDTFTLMFTAALFTIDKKWKQFEYPSTEEWIKKMWYIYIYNGILFSFRKDKMNTIYSNMDDLRDCHAE